MKDYIPKVTGFERAEDEIAASMTEPEGLMKMPAFRVGSGGSQQTRFRIVNLLAQRRKKRQSRVETLHSIVGRQNVHQSSGAVHYNNVMIFYLELTSSV